MRTYPVPNLRRDLPISVVLMIASLAAVFPGAIAAVTAVAAFLGLLALRFTMLSPSSRLRPEPVLGRVIAAGVPQASDAGCLAARATSPVDGAAAEDRCRAMRLASA